MNSLERVCGSLIVTHGSQQKLMNAIVLTEVTRIRIFLKHVVCQIFLHNNPSLIYIYANGWCKLQGVSIINEKCPTVSGFLWERRGKGAQGLKITRLEISVGALYCNTALTFSLPDFFLSLSLPTVVE